MKIYSRWDSSKVVFEHTAATLREAVIAAVDSGADLRGAYLRGADLRDAKKDFIAVLNAAPKEVTGLRDALIDGRVDGSVYEGKCACLVGTIANLKGCNYEKIDGLAPNASRPAERLFLAIRKGDTPETNPTVKLVVEWIDEYMAVPNA